MTVAAIARWSAVAGFSAGAAVVAHVGPAGLLTGPWMAVASVGAAVALLLLGAAWLTVLRLRARAARLAAFDATSAVGRVEFGEIPVAVLASVMLVCQGVAHAGLLLAGVHGAMAASPALHVALAFLGAWSMWFVERWIARHASRVAELIAVLLESLWREARRRLVAVDPPASAHAVAGAGARGPPFEFVVT